MSETAAVTASRIHFHPNASAEIFSKTDLRERQLERLERLKVLFKEDPELQSRFSKVTAFSRQVRASEYHVTNACNIRCKGCWFFEYDHDKETREVKNLDTLDRFLKREKETRRINSALVIGGEPALFLDRLALYQLHMKYLTVSTNGYEKIPLEGFENMTVGISLFGGGPLDDELRAIKPGGKRFSGLFDRALENYKDDPRAGFIYAITEDGIEYIEETVRRIKENGNILNFNFYSKYGQDDPSAQSHREELLAEALRVKTMYPEAVVSHPYYIRTMITGESHWGKFGYENCPSISVDHPAHRARLANGNPSLPLFNTWSADLNTLKFCCTSGHCSGCRDSQAVFSWLLVSAGHFFDSIDMLRTWVEIAESYWQQFYWSPYHRFASKVLQEA